MTSKLFYLRNIPIQTSYIEVPFKNKFYFILKTQKTRKSNQALVHLKVRAYLEKRKNAKIRQNLKIRHNSIQSLTRTDFYPLGSLNLPLKTNLRTNSYLT